MPVAIALPESSLRLASHAPAGYQEPSSWTACSALCASAGQALGFEQNSSLPCQRSEAQAKAHTTQLPSEALTDPFTGALALAANPPWFAAAGSIGAPPPSLIPSTVSVSSNSSSYCLLSRPDTDAATFQWRKPAAQQQRGHIGTSTEAVSFQRTPTRALQHAWPGGSPQERLLCNAVLALVEEDGTSLPALESTEGDGACAVLVRAAPLAQQQQHSSSPPSPRCSIRVQQATTIVGNETATAEHALNGGSSSGGSDPNHTLLSKPQLSQHVTQQVQQQQQQPLPPTDAALVHQLLPDTAPGCVAKQAALAALLQAHRQWQQRHTARHSTWSGCSNAAGITSEALLQSCASLLQHHSPGALRGILEQEPHVFKLHPSADGSTSWSVSLGLHALMALASTNTLNSGANARLTTLPPSAPLHTQSTASATGQAPAPAGQAPLSAGQAPVAALQTRGAAGQQDAAEAMLAEAFPDACGDARAKRAVARMLWGRAVPGLPRHTTLVRCLEDALQRQQIRHKRPIKSLLGAHPDVFLLFERPEGTMAQLVSPRLLQAAGMAPAGSSPQLPMRWPAPAFVGPTVPWPVPPTAAGQDGDAVDDALAEVLPEGCSDAAAKRAVARMLLGRAVPGLPRHTTLVTCLEDALQRQRVRYSGRLATVLGAHPAVFLVFKRQEGTMAQLVSPRLLQTAAAGLPGRAGLGLLPAAAFGVAPAAPMMPFPAVGGGWW